MLLELTGFIRLWEHLEISVFGLILWQPFHKLLPLRPHTRKVAGSTPAASTNTLVDGVRFCAEVLAAKEIPLVYHRVCWGPATRSSAAAPSLRLFRNRLSFFQCSHLFSFSDCPPQHFQAEMNWDEIIPLFFALISPGP
jgi:hypothetical protein